MMGYSNMFGAVPARAIGREILEISRGQNGRLRS